MPIQQLQDQGGIGNLIGMVGGYLAQNPARKAAQAQRETENARNAKTDARLDGEAADRHAETTSLIADRDANLQRTKSNDASAQLSTGAFQKYLPMLSSPPTVDGKPLKGPALANALTAIRTKAVNEGMTDKQHLADFNAEIQRVTQADQAQGAQQFLSGEHALPGDPAQRLSTLMKRLQIERGTPGVDTKPTETMIADTQKQITEAQAAAHQNATDKQRAHHDQVLENQGERGLAIRQQNADRPRVSASSAGSPEAFTDMRGKVGKARTRDDAQNILDSSDLSDRQYTRLQKQVNETFGTHSQADPRKKDAPVQHSRNFSPDQIRQLQRAGASIPHAPDPVAALHAFAKQYNMPLDQAAGFVP